MPILTKQVTVYRCDRCQAESETPHNTIAAGSKFAMVVFETEALVCHRCMTQIVNPHHEREAMERADAERKRHREREAQLERERAYDREQSEREHGHGGATGRPFGSRSSLACAPSSAWNTLQPLGGSLPACARGRDSLLSGSGARSGLLARLLSFQTPAT